MMKEVYCLFQYRLGGLGIVNPQTASYPELAAYGDTVSLAKTIL